MKRIAVILLTLSLCFSAWAQQEGMYSVKVVVSGYKDATIQDYIETKLHSLGDVVIDDNDPDFVLSVKSSGIPNAAFNNEILQFTVSYMIYSNKYVYIDHGVSYAGLNHVQDLADHIVMEFNTIALNFFR